MNFQDSSQSLLATCSGDTVKLFDVNAESGGGDPCTLTYSPSPGSSVNSVKWNHTNLVVASAGDDKNISLWRKNGESMGTIPLAGTDSGDGIEESILSISFSNKGSRYICTGGSGQVVRIWDLQKKRCIKRLKGHTDAITGVMYNCKDEHLASISMSGDLILHNLASGAKAAELKDPNKQVLRMLDYSRISRHLLVTAGDDGSIHLWDTTGRTPKQSWLKQHSAPTSGIGFSPSSDKIIASVGLDKKLYLYDLGSRRPPSCIPYEEPFSSLAYRDEGWILAAGTTSGRVVFYDVRGKPQPFTVLRAYSSSEAVSSLCWQRSKPALVNEYNCTPEIALLGGASEESILMPDPLPSVISSSLSLSTSTLGPRNTSRSGPSSEGSSFATTSVGSISSTPYSSATDKISYRDNVWSGSKLAKLQAPRSTYNFKDDMDVFSPLVAVEPVTPSLDKLWDHGGAKKDHLPADRKSSSLLFPSTNKRFPFTEEEGSEHTVFDWRSSVASMQDDIFTVVGSTLTPSFKSVDSAITPPESWGGERLSDKFTLNRQSVALPSRFGTVASGGLTSGSMLSGFQDITSSTSQMSINSSLTSSNLTYTNLRNKSVSSIPETTSEDFPFSSTSVFLGTKPASGKSGLELPRRFSSYAERMSTTSSLNDGTSLSVGSPKTKKTGAETREELLNNLPSRSDTSAATELGNFPSINGGVLEPQEPLSQPDRQQGSSFTLQLLQRSLEETLASFQKSVHEDTRNLHIEVLRQFHMQEMEMSDLMNSILENQANLMKEVQSLRKENQQLRQML